MFPARARRPPALRAARPAALAHVPLRRHHLACLIARTFLAAALRARTHRDGPLTPLAAV